VTVENYLLAIFIKVMDYYGSWTTMRKKQDCSHGHLMWYHVFTVPS